MLPGIANAFPENNVAATTAADATMSFFILSSINEQKAKQRKRCFKTIEWLRYHFIKLHFGPGRKLATDVEASRIILKGLTFWWLLANARKIGMTPIRFAKD